MQIIIGAVLAAIFAASAYRAHALTKSGAGAAGIVGTVIFGVGGIAFAIPLLTFFISSTLLSQWLRWRKVSLGFEKDGPRDSGQVLANGGVATLCMVAYAFIPSMSAHIDTLYLAALAAANADTWATEIGAAVGRNPVSILTFKRVPVGTSGGVSLAGTLGLVAGSFVIAILEKLFQVQNAHSLVTVVWVSGIAGAVVDSVLGATIQAQWRDVDGKLVERRPVDGAKPQRGLAWVGNDCVNLACTAVAVAVAWLLS